MMKLKILKADRSWSNESNGKGMAGCLASDDGRVIAYFPNVSVMEETSRLLASAPELLAACENALNVLSSLAIGELETIRRDSHAINHLRNAISDAERGEL